MNRRAVSRSRDYTSDYKVARHYNIGRNYPEDSFSSRYDFYDGNKHGTDGLYPCNKDVLGTWKHYNISAETLNARNTRARSPLQSRELDRYFETRKRVNYIGDCSAGGTSDFRYYNYRRVPYFGGSDNYQYMKQSQLDGGPGGFKKHQHHHPHRHLRGGGGGDDGPLRNDILLKLIFEVWIMINDD